MFHAVGAVLLLVAFEIRDRLAVWTPLGTSASTASGRRRDGFFHRSRLGVGHKDLRCRFPIGISAAIAGERDTCSIWRPRRRGLVEFAGGQTLELLRRDVV